MSRPVLPMFGHDIDHTGLVPSLFFLQLLLGGLQRLLHT